MSYPNPVAVSRLISLASLSETLRFPYICSEKADCLLKWLPNREGIRSSFTERGKSKGEMIGGGESFFSFLA
jgi:hypothetical protein